MLKTMIDLTERGLMPDRMVRFGIRQLCRSRLNQLERESQHQPDREQKYVHMLTQSELAYFTQQANEQHYEIPAEYYDLVLGPNKKYSCCYWEPTTLSLEQAERAALEVTADRAGLQNGQQILELGCGWGSLTLFMAQKYPQSQITAISNSSSQRSYILKTAKERGLHNIEVITWDLSRNEGPPLPERRFDRVVSIEMFEHFRNYQFLLSRISRWMKLDGRLFVHIFTHRERAYLFETEGDDNWMGRYFFTGGQMPSHRLLYKFDDTFQVERDWRWSGVHYQKTAEAWLKNHYAHKSQIISIFEKVYGGASEAHRWYYRWAIFYLAVAELFGYSNGNEWGVSHYLMRPKA